MFAVDEKSLNMEKCRDGGAWMLYEVVTSIRMDSAVGARNITY